MTLLINEICFKMSHPRSKIVTSNCSRLCDGSVSLMFVGPQPVTTPDFPSYLFGLSSQASGKHRGLKNHFFTIDVRVPPFIQVFCTSLNSNTYGTKFRLSMDKLEQLAK